MLSKKTSGIVAGVAILLASSSAFASDLNGKGSTKDAGIFAAPTTVNWTGLYIGGSVGYGNANHNLSLHDFWKDYCTDNAGDEGFVEGETDRRFTLANKNERFETAHTRCEDGTWRGNDHTTVNGGSHELASIDGINSSGLVGDGRIGFDLQRDRFVGGVFASYGFNQMETEASIAGLGSASIEKGEEWSIGARAGILVNPRTLAYILAAYTQTDYEFGIAAGGSSASREITFDGVTVGAGVEFAVTNNVFFGIEGTHTFYGKETIFSAYDAEDNEGIRLDDEIGETKVMGTLKIKLNTGLGGIID
jgi:opacity protein-like surface antigen